VVEGKNPQAADESLNDAVHRLLEAQKQPRSLRSLALELDLPVSYLSRAIRGVDGKRASPQLLGRLADTLGVAPHWFAAVREAEVVEAIKRDGELRDRLFGELQRRERRRHR
jgi:transcriptional regulator with XRE-family HTH domain